jgi:bifunctional UDP-N-acetylglucosamine pyrophosphorylase/glucosamine-1-phosphate N-acetyltransferase
VSKNETQAVVLAAGKGTRMRSARAKVLHPIAGVPMLEHVLRTVAALGAQPVTVVVGHDADAVAAAFANRGLDFVRQDPPNGTGHAVQVAEARFSAMPSRTLLVVNGDVPLLRPETLRSLVDHHHATRAAATVLSLLLDEPGAYGRVIRGEDGSVQRIVEARDASAAESAVREVNAGIYAFDVPALVSVLGRLRPQNAQGEYYVTDVVALLASEGRTVQAIAAPDAAEALGVNSQAELQDAARVLRERRATALLEQGVRLEDPSTIEVGLDVQIAADATIRPFTFLEGRTRVAAGAVVGPFARLVDTEVRERAHVRDHCLLEDCVVGADAVVGPFAHIRPQTVIGARAKVGNFVELKKTTLGEGSKVPHLSYVGDATVGSGVNIGAGTITCNYDGTHKHPTTIGDGAFIGSDTTLVAPIAVGAGAYVGAGSALTEDVPAGALALGRARQVTKPGWAAARGRKGAKEASGEPPVHGGESKGRPGKDL